MFNEPPSSVRSTITPHDFKGLNDTISAAVKEKQKFQRLVLKKSEALEMFKASLPPRLSLARSRRTLADRLIYAYPQDNKFKMEIISNKVPDGEVCTAYRCGPLIDLCK
jgi:threonyl-tRNA synthetase